MIGQDLCARRGGMIAFIFYYSRLVYLSRLDMTAISLTCSLKKSSTKKDRLSQSAGHIADGLLSEKASRPNI